jgi:hypothetical protein
MFGFESVGFPDGPPMSIFFFEHHRNDLLRANGVVIVDTGLHLMFHPKDLAIGKDVNTSHFRILEPMILQHLVWVVY